MEIELTLDMISSLLAVFVGGIIAIISSITVLYIQNKQTIKREELNYKKKKIEEKINDLKKYYIEFAAYFTNLKASYFSFILIVNSDEDYKNWFEAKHNSDINYNYNKLELYQKLIFDTKNIKEFYAIHGKLSEICLPNTKNYNYGQLILTLNKNEFKEDFRKFLEFGENHLKEIIETIKEEDKILG